MKTRDDEVFQLEEQYTSLQEEAAGATRKLKKLWTMLETTKAEFADVQQVSAASGPCRTPRARVTTLYRPVSSQDHHNQTEDLLAGIRDLSREVCARLPRRSNWDGYFSPMLTGVCTETPRSCA